MFLDADDLKSDTRLMDTLKMDALVSGNKY